MRLYWAFLLVSLACCAVPWGVCGQDAAAGEEAGAATDGTVPDAGKPEAEKDKHLRELVDQAVQERDNGNYGKALTLLNEVLAEAGVHKGVETDALYARCWTYMLTFRYLLATADIERAIALDPLPNKFYYTRGVIAKDTGQPTEALGWFAKALSIGFHSKALRYTIEIDIRLGNYEAALKDCDWLAGHEPTARATIYRAQALLGLGRPAEALEECNKVLVAGDKEKREGWHYVARADVYFALGEPEKAYYDLATATAKFYPTRDALVRLGDFFMDTEPDYAKAIAYWTALIDVKSLYEPDTVPENQRHEPAIARLRRGQAYLAFDAKRFAANALDDFTKYIALVPDDAKGYAGRARAYVAMGSDVEAKADLVKALELDQGNEEYQRELERLRAGANDSGEHRPSQGGGGAQ
jgi:tetratricopeptide (TPR) repeat protein